MGFFSSIAGSTVVRSVAGLPVTPPLNTIEHDVYIIPQYGQSLALNQGGTPTTFTGTEPLAYDTSLVNTNGLESVAGVAEAFQIAATENGVTIPANFKIVGFVSGNGGTSLSNLSKGTTYYNSVLSNVQTAKNNCDTAGLTCVVPCFTWTQGEEDMRTGGDVSQWGVGNFDPLTYSDRLQQLIIDFNTDIKAITGQTEDIMCVSYQNASHNAYARYPRIPFEQLQLADNYSLMTIGKVMYDVEYSTDEVHAVAKTYRNMGNMYGLAAFNSIVKKEKPKYLKPLSHVVNGAEVTITFDVPVAPLALDTTLVTQLTDGNYGFNILNVSGENAGTSGTISEATTRITNVALSGSDKVVLTLSRTPVVGERITYGVNAAGWTNINGVNWQAGKSGHVDGARGCLRDSQPIKNNNAGAVFTELYNWSVKFEIVI